MSKNQSVVYLNGQFLPRSEAKMDVEERGTMFADGVYEVLRYYGGRALAMAAHVERLRLSMEAIRLPRSEHAAALGRVSDELMHRNGLADAVVYWQVSRGSAKRNHAIPNGVAPTVMALAYGVEPVDPKADPDAVTAVLVPDVRWHHCQIKSLMLLPAVLAHDDARRTGAEHALLHRDGTVTEGSAHNVIIVRGGDLRTHPANQWILAGITRAILLERARSAGIEVSEEPFTTEDLLAADEVLITGTTTHVAAVVKVDGRNIKHGRVGPMAKRLRALLMQEILKE